MEIMLSQEDYRYVAEAISSDLKISYRIRDTAKILADQIRAGACHTVDSLTVGTMAAGRAEDAILEELVVQVLVGTEIVTERHSHEKYKMREYKACEGRRIADTIFDERRKDLIDETRRQWMEFQEWKQARAKSNTPPQAARKGKGGK